VKNETANHNACNTYIISKLTKCNGVVVTNKSNYRFDYQ